MAKLLIQVGASADRSLTVAYQPLVEAAKKARKQIASEMNAGSRDAEASFKRLKSEVTGGGAHMMDGGARAIRDFGKEAKASFDGAARDFDAMANKVSADMKRIERAQKNVKSGWNVGPGKMGQNVTQGAGAAAAYGRQISGDLARGFGLDMGIASNVQKSVSNHALAADISNAGLIRGASGAAGQRVETATILSEASAVGKATGTDTNEALKGLSAFVAKTGDLETGRAILEDMAKLAKATGSNMGDVVSSAGDISSVLGDIPNKGKALDAVMRGVAGQGKLGAVEFKDLSTQMAKIAAAASQFGGDAANNVMMMGMLAQEARSKGGAASGSQAANAAAGFVNTLKTPARIAQFKAQGIDVFDKDKNLRDPRKLIMESLKKTGGDPEKMKKLFANVMGEKAITGYAASFRGAGGGRSGEAAVNASFAKMLEGSMLTKEQVEEDFQRRMKEADSKVAVFNDRMQDIADKMVSRVIPAFEKLEPQVTNIAEAFGDFIGWASENPWQAAEVALAASITKSALDQTIKSGVEKAFASAGGGSIAVAAMAVTAGLVTMQQIDKALSDGDDKQRANVASGIGVSNMTGKARVSGKVTPAEQAELEAELKRQEGKLATGKKNFGKTSLVEDALGAATVISPFGGNKASKEAEAQRFERERGELASTAKAIESLKGVLEQIRDKKIDVTKEPLPGGSKPPSAGYSPGAKPG